MLPDLRHHFARFLGADDVLHVAAHSHHPWPDVTHAAHVEAWDDAARLKDEKWSLVFGEVLPETQAHVARILGLPDPATVAFAPNTHELVVKILSGLPQPARVLTTTSEFYSFARQMNRFEEDGRVEVERVEVEPYGTFVDRFVAAAGGGGHDLVFFSHVMFDSGFRVDGLERIVRAVPDDGTVIAIDGYHGFMALPTDISAIADRAFYLTGGYKYAMAGEGACGMHCPPGYVERPAITGWFASFDQLAEGRGDRVAYDRGGMRFLGATLDPTPWYRFNAVQRWLQGLGIEVADIHEHVGGLQSRLLDALERDGPDALHPRRLDPGPDIDARGNFLVFVTDDGEAVHRRLREAGVLTDRRGDRVRVGFGLYHRPEDVTDLVSRANSALS